jgi:3-hydroxybutyryl-CoA dehydrogenase
MRAMSFGGERIGVVGAGSMGAGIAELAVAHGFAVVLVDAAEEALGSARSRIEAGLERSVEPGRTSRDAADAALSRLVLTTELDRLAPCDAVIEAASERLELKRELFAKVAAICPSPTLLATNTSSLRVSAIAAGVEGPERVVGMHFFNPPTQMKLLEVIAGFESGEEHVRRAADLGEQLGKRVINAGDGIGFLVNRTARPFVGEALRLVQEGIATFSQIDRICRMGGGFRMGPFELVDLIGVDVNLEITESFWFQSYGEPRWRPSPIQTQLVDAGRLGRKSGAGFYAYGEREREPDPRPPEAGGGAGRLVALGGLGSVADFLRVAARTAGFEVCDWQDSRAASAWLAVDADPCRRLGPGNTRSVEARTMLCASDCLGRRPNGACGFHLLGPADESRLVEVSKVPESGPISIERTKTFFSAIGLHVEEVGDSPGMVLGRIVAQLINEAAFSLEEGVASPADIDAGARLGLNYPRGPIEWSEAAGLDHVRAILRALGRRRGEERYRLSPLLQDARDDLRGPALRLP